MQFDPTFDYGKTDMSIPENGLKYNFRQLIQNLITLASTAERQKEIIGVGWVCQEMAEDYDSYFVFQGNKGQNYLNLGLLTEEQVSELNHLETLFVRLSKNPDDEFWDDEQLSTNKNWEEVRNLARRILTLLKMENLEIQFTRTTDYSLGTAKPNLTVEHTRLWLSWKGAS